MISANGLQVRYNPMRITNFDVFCSMRGAYRPPVKDVYFICWAGCPDKPEPFCQRLGTLVASAKDTGILCENRLDTYLCPEDAAKAQTWLFSAGKPQVLPFDFADSLLAETFSIAFSEMISLYQQYRQHTTASMLRNFQIKLLYWAYRYLPALFPAGKLLSVPPKAVYLSQPGLAESLFFYLLTRLGCDVAVVCPEGEPALPEGLLPYVCQMQGTPCPDTPLIPAQAPAPQLAGKQRMRLPPHPGRHSAAPMPVPMRERVRTPPAAHPPQAASQPKELAYEQLAQLAASVVMIETLEQTGDCLGSGSGVLIAPGIILTNFHVVRGGCAYRIRLENDDQPYITDELLKYHSAYDLALLRIAEYDRPPLPVYRGGGLVRGQQVVAIGSPLGLFNSVSDGIISGFRQIEEKSMIQFTAPTSPGSSGGALLNRAGEVIGIITGAFSEGQNLNLAVDAKTILPFIRGFMQ